MHVSLSEAEVTTPILQMRETEGWGRGYPGRLSVELQHFIILLEDAPGEEMLLSHWPTPVSQELRCPSKNLKIENLEGLKSQRMFQSPERKGGSLYILMAGIQSYFLFQLDAHSPVTGLALRIERYLLHPPAHFLPHVGISPSAEPSAPPLQPRYIRVCSPGDRRQNRFPFPSEPFSSFIECLTVSMG